MLKINKIACKIKDKHKSMYAYDEFDTRIKNNLIIYIILIMTISQAAAVIYIPSMPAMVHAFNTDNVHIKQSLNLYLIGYGISQFFYGPISDIYGRRWMILWGMGIFLASTLLALFSKTVDIFLFSRFLQGVGLGCGDTMGRAILCDRFREKEFVKAASLIGMAATIMPLVAPIMGGYFEVYLDWRASFVFLLLYGLVNSTIILFYLPETKPKSLPVVTSFTGVLNRYWFVLKNRIFLGFFIPGLVSFVGEMVYNMLSPFLLQVQLGLSPISFGWLALFIVIGLLIGTFISHYLAGYWSNYLMVLNSMCILLLGSLCMLVPSLFQHISVISIILPMTIFAVGIGITYPNTNMGALTPFTSMAGTAGALQGGLQMLAGGAIGVALGEIPTENQLWLALTLTTISLIGLIAFLILLKQTPNK
jgi:Bcr/CflA subfamily drug resistance transporter